MVARPPRLTNRSRSGKPARSSASRSSASKSTVSMSATSTATLLETAKKVAMGKGTTGRKASASQYRTEYKAPVDAVTGNPVRGRPSNAHKRACMASTEKGVLSSAMGAAPKLLLNGKLYEAGVIADILAQAAAKAEEAAGDDTQEEATEGKVEVDVGAAAIGEDVGAVAVVEGEVGEDQLEAPQGEPQGDNAPVGGDWVEGEGMEGYIDGENTWTSNWSSQVTEYEVGGASVEEDWFKDQEMDENSGLEEKWVADPQVETIREEAMAGCAVPENPAGDYGLYAFLEEYSTNGYLEWDRSGAESEAMDPVNPPAPSDFYGCDVDGMLAREVAWQAQSNYF